MKKKVTYVARRILPERCRYELASLRFRCLERHWLRHLRQIIEPCKQIIDVGASKGYFARWLARRSLCVHAYEPNPYFYEILCRHSGKRIVPHREALSNRTGTAELRVPVRDGLTNDYYGSLTKAFEDCELRTYEVSVRRLDDCGHSNVGFIKIDVEGHEDEVLQGVLTLLEAEKPHIYVEIEQRHRRTSIARTFEWLQRLGYQGLFAFCGQIFPVEEFSVVRHQSMGAASQYVANFLFTHQREARTLLKEK